MKRDIRKAKVIIECVVIIILLVTTVLGGIILKKSLELKKEIMSLQYSKVVLYEGPKTLKDATDEDLKNTAENNRDFSIMHCVDTKIEVNGQECYVYDTNVNHTRSWVSNYLPPQARTPITYFDFEGRIEIKVTVPKVDLESVKISPLSYDIKPEIDRDNHTVKFYIDTPDTYTLVFNDAPQRAVHIFANALENEDELPDFNDENVIYIGPGEWDVETISMRKGQTLYLAGGAVVHGIVNANFESDITVCGRGILDGSKIEGWKGGAASIPLKFDHCSKITLKDIIVLNPNAWVCQAYDSSDGIIDGIKIISSRPNGDGITIQSCSNYEIRNCFVRSWDDSLVVKNYDLNTDNILFENIQLWTDFAQSMEIGFETNKGKKEDAYINNVCFKNITVLNNFHKPVISVHNADDAIVENITFQDIVVEHEEVGSGDSNLPYLIDMSILQNSNWSSTTNRGQIRNVIVDNVNFLEGSEKGSRIQGYDSEHIIENVKFSNIKMFGKDIEKPEDGTIVVDESSTNNITFK